MLETNVKLQFEEEITFFLNRNHYHKLKHLSGIINFHILQKQSYKLKSFVLIKDRKKLIFMKI